MQPTEVFDPSRLPRTHRVSGDETLYDVATRYQVPLRALIDQKEQVRLDAREVQALAELPSGGLVDAFLDAKLKNRAATTMVSVDWEKERLDRGLEELGAQIRELFGS